MSRGIPYLLLVGVLSVFSVARSQRVRAADLSAEDAVAEYEKTLGTLNRAEFRITIEEYWTGGALPQETLVQESKWFCRRLDDRWKLQHDAVYRRLVKGKLVQSERTTEYVVASVGSIFVANNGRDEEYSVVAFLETETQKQRSGIYYLGDRVTPLFGYVPGNKMRFLPELLRDSKLTVGSGRIDGHDTVKLESEGPYGRHTLWLDPAVSYHPRKIEIYKGLNDIVGKRRLSEYKPTRKGGMVPPNTTLSEIVYTIDVTSLERIDDVDVITAFVTTTERKYASGDEVTIRTLVKLADISLRPDESEASFMVSQEIPKGTLVQVNDKPNIVYEWTDGEIVKSLNQPAVAGMHDQTFQNGGVRFYLLLINLLVVVAFFVVWVLRHRSRSATNGGDAAER